MICNHQLKLHLHFHSFCHILQLCQKLIAHFSLVSVCLFISNRDFIKLFNLESTKNFPKEAQYIRQLLMEKSVVDRIILCADEDDEKQQYVSTSQSPPVQTPLSSSSTTATMFSSVSPKQQQLQLSSLPPVGQSAIQSILDMLSASSEKDIRNLKLQEENEKLKKDLSTSKKEIERLQSFIDTHKSHFGYEGIASIEVRLLSC